MLSVHVWVVIDAFYPSVDVFSLNESWFLIHEEFRDTGSGARAFGGSEGRRERGKRARTRGFLPPHAVTKPQKSWSFVTDFSVEVGAREKSSRGSCENKRRRIWRIKYCAIWWRDPEVVAGSERETKAGKKKKKKKTEGFDIRRCFCC